VKTEMMTAKRFRDKGCEIQLSSILNCSTDFEISKWIYDLQYGFYSILVKLVLKTVILALLFMNTKHHQNCSQIYLKI